MLRVDQKAKAKKPWMTRIEDRYCAIETAYSGSARSCRVTEERAPILCWRQS